MNQYYALKHLPTGKYQPAVSNQSRGMMCRPLASLDEKPPRLFTTYKGANQAKHVWVKTMTDSVREMMFHKDYTMDMLLKDLVIVEINLYEGNIHAEGYRTD